MNLFQNVKYGVNCREAAERYGVSINRQGKALCPFHNDRHPSLYVADDHFYCFACGAHGDVIDFAANFLICRFTKPPSVLRQTSALMQTNRRQRKFLKNADRKQKHRMNDLRKPVTSWTRRNITWIFLLSGIPMNVPKLSIICL